MFFARQQRDATGRRKGRANRARGASRFGPGIEGLERRAVLTYLGPVSYAVGTGAAGVTVGNFDGDGSPDIAVADQGTGTVAVLLGNGGGTFQPKVNYAAGPGAGDVKAGDFNGDGRADLAVVGSNSVGLLLGNGDGSFAAPTTSPVGLGSHSLNVGDLNGDGNLDVATMNGTTASVLLGNGDGTFRPRIDASIPGNSTTDIRTWPRPTPPASARSRCCGAAGTARSTSRPATPPIRPRSTWPRAISTTTGTTTSPSPTRMSPVA